jgi:hypothetical protein
MGEERNKKWENDTRKMIIIKKELGTKLVSPKRQLPCAREEETIVPF